MLKYKRVYSVDNELYEFHLAQKQYYQLEGLVPTREYLMNEMKVLKGFDENNHYIYKIYFKNKMIALIDYQIGYRYSMKHDDKYLWIGLLLVDETYQRKKIGQEIIEYFINEYRGRCNRMQLGCIKDNFKGMAFWSALGFKEIDISKYRKLEIKVLEKKI